MFCSVEGCDRPRWCRGLCVAHYFRARRGDVREHDPIGARKNGPICSIEDCCRKTYARQLCEMHYRRLLRKGDTDKYTVEPDQRICSVDDCEKAVDARGLCHGHYQRLIRHGDVRAHEPLNRRTNGRCIIANCGRPAHRRGLCFAHAKRVIRRRDVMAEVPVKAQSGNGSINGGGYRTIPVPTESRHLTNGQTSEAEHRLIMAIHLGRPLHPGEVVHHRNGVRTDNRIENLVLLSASHPKGQTIDDKVAHALEILGWYRPELLASPQDVSPL